MFNATLRQNKVVAVLKLESAQPSLKIKEELTFNAKKHTERGEVVEPQRPTRPPSFSARSQSKHLESHVCVSVCLCVCVITCTSQHRSHALLLSETGVVEVKYLDGMQGGHVGGGQRLKVGHETDSEGGVDKLEKIFAGIPQSNNSDLFLWPNLQKWSRHLFFWFVAHFMQHYRFSVFARQKVALCHLGRLRGCF